MENLNLTPSFMRQFEKYFTDFDDTPKEESLVLPNQICMSNREIYTRFCNGENIDVRIRPWGKSNSFDEAPPICVDFTDLDRAKKYIAGLQVEVDKAMKTLETQQAAVENSTSKE